MMSLLFFMVKRAHLKKIELILCYCMINFFFLYLNFIFLKAGTTQLFVFVFRGRPQFIYRGRYVLGYSFCCGFIGNRLGRWP
jgi:hypothetical protein